LLNSLEFYRTLIIVKYLGSSPEASDENTILRAEV